MLICIGDAQIINSDIAHCVVASARGSNGCRFGCTFLSPFVCLSQCSGEFVLLLEHNMHSIFFAFCVPLFIISCVISSVGANSKEIDLSI